MDRNHIRRLELIFHLYFKRTQGYFSSYSFVYYFTTEELLGNHYIYYQKTKLQKIKNVL